MSQVNVNSPTPVVEDTAGDRSAAAGINFVTVLVVLAVLAVLAWFLFTGPLRSMTGGATPGSSTNVTVNPPAQQAPNVTINPPAQPPAQQPAPKP